MTYLDVSGFKRLIPEVTKHFMHGNSKIGENLSAYLRSACSFKNAADNSNIDQINALTIEIRELAKRVSECDPSLNHLILDSILELDDYAINVLPDSKLDSCKLPGDVFVDKLKSCDCTANRIYNLMKDEKTIEKKIASTQDGPPMIQ